MSQKKFDERQKRAIKIARELGRLFPEPKSVLTYARPWELVVAVILSAQTTDKKVNEITNKLFKKYKKIEDYAAAKTAVLAKDIYPVSFYRTKAKNLVAAARIIKKGYNGKVPENIDELIRLPGVGRKTANVVLGNLYGKTEGIAVDTHVRRFARKYELTDNSEPSKIELDLMQLLPKKYWFTVAQGLVIYGQRICPARRHDCNEHPLTKLYPASANIWPKSR